MTIYEGWKLRRDRQREGIAIDALAHALSLTLVDVLELEDSLIVSEEIGTRYLQATRDLRPTARHVRRHYRREYGRTHR